MDLTKSNQVDGRACFLEGTGALVLDRINGVAYMCVSERADKALLEDWAAKVGYRRLVTFAATDAEDRPIYHTNVMMASAPPCAGRERCREAD